MWQATLPSLRSIPYPQTPVHMCEKTETFLVDMQARLEAVASGRMDALVVWFDLHLAEGVPITSGEEGEYAAGRGLSSTAVPPNVEFAGNGLSRQWPQQAGFLSIILVTAEPVTGCVKAAS